MSDIVERLVDGSVGRKDHREAASEILALRLRNAELRAHRDSLNSDLARGHQEAEALDTAWRKALAEAIALRLRVERLERNNAKPGGAVFHTLSSDGMSPSNELWLSELDADMTLVPIGGPWRLPDEARKILAARAVLAEGKP